MRSDMVRTCSFLHPCIETLVLDNSTGSCLLRWFHDHGTSPFPQPWKFRRIPPRIRRKGSLNNPSPSFPLAKASCYLLARSPCYRKYRPWSHLLLHLTNHCRRLRLKPVHSSLHSYDYIDSRPSTIYFMTGTLSSCPVKYIPVLQAAFALQFEFAPLPLYM